MKTLFILLGVVIALVSLAWLGLQVRPKPFPAYSQQAAVTNTVPLPDRLPVPVDRFYRQVYGESVPLIESAVLTGRAKMRIMGITFPTRFRFTHDAGQGYRHYIEATLFGLPLMKVNEYYLDGRGRMELPLGVIDDDTKVNQGANLGLWAESIWLPSIFLTDPRVRWEPMNEETALLVVPFGEEEQQFVARFDPQTGLLRFLESMRYKGADSEAKSLWINEVVEWGSLNGKLMPTIATPTWFEDGTPWVVFTVEDVAYNVDVREYIRARGP